VGGGGGAGAGARDPPRPRGDGHALATAGLGVWQAIPRTPLPTDPSSPFHPRQSPGAPHSHTTNTPTHISLSLSTLRTAKAGRRLKQAAGVMRERTRARVLRNARVTCLLGCVGIMGRERNTDSYLGKKERRMCPTCSGSLPYASPSSGALPSAGSGTGCAVCGGECKCDAMQVSSARARTHTLLAE